MEQVTEKDEFVTKPAYLRSVGLAFKHLLDEHLTPLKARVKAVEERGAVPADVATRLSAVEVRTGALSMLYGKGADAERIAALDDLLRRTKHLEQLEARIKELERRPAGMRYLGVWKAGLGYEPGSVVTDHGSMWHAQRTTIARPGTSPTDWTLCAKGGKGLP